jgi:hypothetical protein
MEGARIAYKQEVRSSSLRPPTNFSITCTVLISRLLFIVVQNDSDILRSNSSIAILRLSEAACVQMLMVVCSIRVPHLRSLILDRAHTVEVGRKGPPQRLERYCDQDVGACFQPSGICGGSPPLPRNSRAHARVVRFTPMMLLLTPSI